MKKNCLKTATWIILLLFLVGCKQAEPFPLLDHTLHCRVMLQKNEMQYEAELESPVLGSYEFELMSPPSLKGMKVTLQNGMISYIFQGITHSKEQGEPISLLEQIAGILEQAVRWETLVWEVSENQWTGNGRYMDVPFTVACDKKTNRPVSIKTQDGLTVELIHNK